MFESPPLDAPCHTSPLRNIRGERVKWSLRLSQPPAAFLFIILCPPLPAPSRRASNRRQTISNEQSGLRCFPRSSFSFFTPTRSNGADDRRMEFHFRLLKVKPPFRIKGSRLVRRKWRATLFFRISNFASIDSTQQPSRFHRNLNISLFTTPFSSGVTSTFVQHRAGS